jgi:hypothetical protein
LSFILDFSCSSDLNSGYEMPATRGFIPEHRTEDVRLGEVCGLITMTNSAVPFLWALAPMSTAVHVPRLIHLPGE